MPRADEDFLWRERFARAASQAIAESLPRVEVLLEEDHSLRLYGLSVPCDLEAWLVKWRNGGPTRDRVAQALAASLKQARARQLAAESPPELDSPEPATIVAFSEMDRIGRLSLQNGEQLRFGETACKSFQPSVGARVFITVVAPHPLGGRRAVVVRDKPITERKAREAVAAHEAQVAADKERERANRRELARDTTTPAAILARIKAALPLDDSDADEGLLAGLVEDLRLVGPNLSHVTTILQVIAESPPMIHFGSPGPLVHYLERFDEYPQLLFEISRSQPRSHFLWMLGRIANEGGAEGEVATAILRSHATDPACVDILRAEIAEFLQS